MNAMRFWLAAASYFVITMLWAYPWHVVWFHDKYVAMGAFQREAPVMPLGVAAVVTQGLVLSYLYPCWYRGGNPVLSGVRFSLIAGLLVYTAMGFATAAKFSIAPIGEFLAYHTVFQTLQFIFTGAAMGAIYGRTPTCRGQPANELAT